MAGRQRVKGRRKAHNLPASSHRQHVWDPNLNRAYAADYLALLQRDLSRRLNQAALVCRGLRQVYAAYNMGLNTSWSHGDAFRPNDHLSRRTRAAPSGNAA